MSSASENAFFLEVNTKELTLALKHLLKADKRNEIVTLKFTPGTPGALRISIGQTSRDLTASGSWFQPVFVSRKWAKALAKTPLLVAITTLRQADGKLYARDFYVRSYLTLQDWPNRRAAILHGTRAY